MGDLEKALVTAKETKILVLLLQMEVVLKNLKNSKEKAELLDLIKRIKEII